MVAITEGRLSKAATSTRSLTTSRPEELDPRWARFFRLSWPAAAILMIAIEPPPATEPSVLVAAIGLVIALGLVVAIVGTVVQSARRNPSAVNWATSAALLAVVATATCPVSGHHQRVGAWWYAQMALSVGMLVLSRIGAVQGRESVGS